ncbi:DUF2382 domain-containing protein [Chthonobacter albigriseus]|uniref:DUF2382 domain-containing protein n=1 Tax=Chthonobacter albigriseus TaxID=1683161 RepID=UPI0015EE720D|nr:DUF2382 domain-containing protein [Chthonobacter albigriseus]
MTSPEPESDERLLRLAEEEARIEKREVVTGRVRVRTVADTVEETVGATLEGEAVEIDRVPMDRIVTEAPAIRTEGDVTVIPVVEEVLVVEKRLVLTEEIRIRRRRTAEAVEVLVSLRRMRADVERLPADDET